jgi:adenylate cyclase
MINCIERNQGVVHDFVGDGIMSVYGGLIDTDNPCDKALKACLEMNEELKILNEKWTKAGMESFKIGVGLHYGEVTLGAIGSETRKEFAVIGDTVNTASKMESLTKDLKHIAVCSNKFYDQLTIKYKRHCTLIGDVEIKGKKNPVIIYACYNKYA